jgi:hypothetical protein
LPRCFISDLLHWAFGVGRSVFGFSPFCSSAFVVLYFARRGQAEGLGNLQRAVELDSRNLYETGKASASEFTV